MRSQHEKSQHEKSHLLELYPAMEGTLLLMASETSCPSSAWSILEEYIHRK